MHIRFRFNAAGLQFFNPTDRRWCPVQGEAALAEFGKLLENVTGGYPQQVK